ncbi:MAG: relaxase/mobilization nuclease domain-containing protein, partial [Candidatus Thiodiazotropha endolucinida]
MIPFASQRALGQDLATHLLNEYDNDYMEVADVRGAVAGDLHGAFAEWEAQAHALTKCENYLYSLSINPDQRQGRLTRDQYMDYIDRVEEKLGFSDQGRAIVFHIKDDREHAHVVWSRIDLEKEKAVQMSFDRDKLMMVTRLFAKEHGLELPKGYEKDRGKEGKGQQLSLYEMHQKRTTGLSRDERQEQVTDAWRSSDSAKAFVQALADKGYILASGNRPYVLVDLYGGMNALPKMITDKTVRTKDIRAFLERDYPPDSLPHVDEAREMAARHRKAMEEHIKAEQRADKLNDLKKMQQGRRQKREAEQAALKRNQHTARDELTAQHKGECKSLRAAYVMQASTIKQKRYQNRPTGLAAFIGRVSGIA